MHKIIACVIVVLLPLQKSIVIYSMVFFLQFPSYTVLYPLNFTNCKMYRKRLLYLIIIAAFIRLLVASMLELGNDEVYYYTYALHLQSNYFDHPPGVGILIKLFTLNLKLQSEVFLRLGSIVCAAIGTVISFCIG